MKLYRYVAEDASAWDALVDAAPNGTFLHARRFLAYHGTRFQDVSLVIRNDGDSLVAVFPAAVDPGDPQHVISHPGATYGGLVAPSFSASDTISALQTIIDHYASEGFTRLTYKLVPPHFTAVPAQADSYALWRFGAALTRRDLWSVIWAGGKDAGQDGRSRRRQKWRARVAERHNLEIFEDASNDAYRRFHQLLCGNLQERHGIVPVHTADELIDLRERLGDKVSLLLVAQKDRHEEPVAGVWLFRFGNVAWHTQYISANEVGRKCRATHLLLQFLLSEFRTQGIAALSYGAVTEQNGQALNSGLERFKAEYGAGLVTHDFYTVTFGSR